MRHTFKAFAFLFLHKYYNMTFHHKIIYALQFLLNSLVIVLILFLKPTVGQIAFVLAMVFLSELALVFLQSLMNQSEIYYKKSCLFALGDLLAATAYLGYFILSLCAWLFDRSFEYLIWPMVILFAYTLFRKIYIFKNYTYEK